MTEEEERIRRRIDEVMRCTCRWELTNTAYNFGHGWKATRVETSPDCTVHSSNSGGDEASA